MNKHIGNDDLGVTGNHADVSRGGHLVRSLLNTGQWVLVNNIQGVVEGGPFTRLDPTTGKLSCLDIMVCSVGLVPFIDKLIIDSDRKFAAKRGVYEKGRYRLGYSDHFSLILYIHNLPTINTKVEKKKVWNLRKEQGWERYEKLTDKMS